jgi:hypothetical protein
MSDAENFNDLFAMAGMPRRTVKVRAVATSAQNVFELTEHELQQIAFVAAQRHCYDLSRGRKNRYGAPERLSMLRHYEGAFGEYVVAKAFRAFWNGSVGNFNADDVVVDVPGVGPVQVRATQWPDGHMLIHRDDKDHRRYYLVTINGKIGRIAGWRLARDCKRPELWGERREQPGRPCFWVPQKDLNEFEPIE